jgi:hypothetical protein
VLLIALILGGIVLAISSKNSGDATSTAIAQLGAIFTTQTAQAVDGTLTATYRPSATFTPSATASNTALPTATSSFTAVPPTATNVPPIVVPPTQTPTRTPTLTPSPTNTSVPPTDTPTRTPTLTPSSTNTPVPPTDTPTRTPTLTPSSTNTPVPPTATPTFTPTPVPPTATPTLVPPTAAPIVSTIAPTTVQQALIAGKLPFVNDMESPQAIDGWDYDKNVWGLKIDSGNVALVSSGDFRSVAIMLPGKPTEWSNEGATNLLFSYSINLDTPSSIGRFIFRNSPQGYYAVELAMGQVKLLRGKTQDPTKPTTDRLVAFVQNTTIRNGAWYQVEVWSETNRIFVYIDNKLILSAEDTGDPLPGGLIMFESINKNFRTKFDNIKIQRPLPASQHFQGSGFPNTWQRSDETGAKVVSDSSGNGFIDLTAGNVSPANPPISNLQMFCRLWVVAGGFEMRMREGQGGQLLFHFEGGNLTLTQLDGAKKVVQKWDLPNFYGRQTYFNMGIQMLDEKLTILNGRDEFVETLKNPPPPGTIHFSVNPGDDLRIDDCLFVETATSATEDATWAFDKVSMVEARNPQPLLSEWYDKFDDQFRTKDWWEGGTNAPGQFKVAGADNKHPNYLEMTYKDGASWRMFRYIREIYAFGLGQDKANFFDSSDIYLRTEVRILNAGTAWIAARTSVSAGGGTLNGYRIELTKAQDGTYTVVAKGYSLNGQPVYYQGPLPLDPNGAQPDWVQLLIVCYQNKVAFFANNHFLGATNNAMILDGTVALGVEPGSTADFDQLQLRDVSPETR